MAFYQKINGSWTKLTNTSVVPTFLSQLMVGYEGDLQKTDTSFNTIWSLSAPFTQEITGIGVTPDKVYVTNKGDNTIKKVDKAAGTVDWSTTLSGTPVSLKLDGSTAYVGSYGPDAVTKVDSTGNIVWEYTSFAGNVAGLSVTSAGNIVGGTALSPEVRKLDSGGNLLWQFSTSGGGIRELEVDSNSDIIVADGPQLKKVASDGSSVIWSDTSPYSYYNDLTLVDNSEIIAINNGGRLVRLSNDGTEQWNVATSNGGGADVTITNNNKIFASTGYNGSNYEAEEFDYQNGSSVNTYTSTLEPFVIQSFITKEIN